MREEGEALRARLRTFEHYRLRGAAPFRRCHLAERSATAARHDPCSLRKRVGPPNTIRRATSVPLALARDGHGGSMVVTRNSR